MGGEQDIYLWVLLHIRIRLRDTERIGSKVRDDGSYFQGYNILSSDVHVRDAEGVADNAIFLDLLHCEVVHFCDSVIQAGHSQLRLKLTTKIEALMFSLYWFIFMICNDLQ